MEEDDEILEEIPVYLSKNLHPNVSVIQFPVSNKQYDLDQPNIVNCCFKPKSQQVKIDFGLETDSRNYDAFKGDQLAKSADGNRGGGPSTSRGGGGGNVEDRNDRPSFSSGRMDKVTFVSSLAVDNPRYAVGMMLDGELHLTPVHKFFQMRQPYAYFDKGDKRSKAEKDEKDQEEGVEEEAKAVTVKFAKTADNERAKKAKEKSFYHFSQIGKDEPWCETMIYGSTTLQSELERKKFPYQTVSSDVPHFVNIPPNEYFHKLIDTDAYTLDASQAQLLSSEANKTEEKMAASQSELRGIFSKRHIKKMPLLDQLKFILRDAKVLSFSELMDMVSAPDITVEKVLRNLALCGVMIHGNWTLQSEVLYPSTFKSLTNGISGELMCRGRDYVLYKIAHNELSGINRQRIMTVTQLPNEETREILESVAMLTWKYDDWGNKKAVWELIKKPDIDFEKRHVEIYQRQETLWKAQEDKFLEMEQEKSEKRKRTRSVREIKVEK